MLTYVQHTHTHTHTRSTMVWVFKMISTIKRNWSSDEAMVKCGNCPVMSHIDANIHIEPTDHSDQNTGIYTAFKV